MQIVMNGKCAHLDAQEVKDTNGALLYVDRMCPMVHDPHCLRGQNFAETVPNDVLLRALHSAHHSPGRWFVVAWGRVSGRWCDPVGLIRVSGCGGCVDFSYFEPGRQDFALMQKQPSEYPEIVAVRLNQDDNLLLGRNLLRFPRGGGELRELAERMSERVFKRR